MGKLQHKLVQTLLATSTLPLIILSAITIMFLEKMAVNDMQQRISSGLNAASSVYDTVYDNLRFTVRDKNRRVFTLIDEEQLDLLRNEFEKIVRDKKMDFFVITDAKGKVIISITHPELEGYNIAHDSLVRRVLATGEFSVSTEIMDKEQLNDYGLFAKALLPGVEKTEGMVIRSVFPVINTNEIIVGTMSAGYLLNNNNSIIIDPIQKNTGFISSVFMRDIRVCSNVPTDGQDTVLGSRIDTQKARVLLEKGQDHTGRVFLAKNWYLAGYTPIYNADKNIVGILGIGMPEALVFKLRDDLTKIFIAAVMFSIVMALVFGFWRGDTIIRPIKKLRTGIEAVTIGNFEHRIDIHSNDEIQEVGAFFNKMTEQLLNAKKQLDETHKQLIEYERMAAIGRMASVLNHELRNVFAGIEVSLYYLKAKVSKDFPELGGVTQDIEKEISYANSLMTNISMFGRPRKIVLGEVDVNALVEDVLNNTLLQEMAKNNKIEVIKNLGSGIPLVKADAIQLKEVVLNLAINAIQAMPLSGTLTLSTQAEDKALKITVEDTGKGIPEENIKNLFTPFFTTKSKGLGLGLFIARDIIDLHKGRIEVDSEPEQGTRFKVILPFTNV